MARVERPRARARRRRRASRCSSACASRRSSRPTSTSSAWCASPSCSKPSAPRPTGRARRASCCPRRCSIASARGCASSSSARASMLAGLLSELKAAGIAVHARLRGGGARAGRARGHVPRQHLPRADAARRRPGEAVPVHLEPLALARRHAARPRDGPAAPRARQGAGGAAALPARRRRRRSLRDARGPDRHAPRLALPRHGDRGARGLPRHARRGLRDRGGGRRPALGGRARAAPPPLRRGRARRARELDVRRHARTSCSRTCTPTSLRVRRRRAARPCRPGRARRARPARAALPASGRA